MVVDEGQDLHAGHWRVLRGLVDPGPNDMFLCEDGFQRIYGDRVVLGHFGIETRGRSRRLTLNYRTTRQNLRFAMSVIENEPIADLDGDDETVAGYHSSFDGPKPERYGFGSDAEEMRFVAETVSTWVESGVEAKAIAVLSRRSQEQDRARAALRDAGVAVERRGPGGARRERRREARDHAPVEGHGVLARDRRRGRERGAARWTGWSTASRRLNAPRHERANGRCSTSPAAGRGTSWS